MAQGDRVQLYIYDLSGGMAKAFSRMLLDKQASLRENIDGVWHTSVVVRGTEFYFGHGINAATPGTTPCGTPVQILDLGLTQLDADMVDTLLADLSERYTPESYSLFSNNCNNFSDDFARLLTGVGVPDHITGLPAEVLATPFGQMLAPALKGLEAQLGSMGTPVAAANGQRRDTGAQAMPSASTAARQPAAGRAAAQILGAQLAAALAGAAPPSATAATPAAAPSEAEPVSPRTLSRDLDAAIARTMIVDRGAAGQAVAGPAADDRTAAEEHVAAETARLMSESGGGLNETEAAALALQHEAAARKAADA